MQPLLWWIYKKIRPVYNISGIRFIDIRLVEDGSGQVVRLLKEAVNYLQAAGDHYRDLVANEIAFVAATRHPRENISLPLRAYLSPFQGHEGESGFYLACRLVWVATYLQGFRNPSKHGVRNDTEVRKQSFEGQIRFVDEFPDSAMWRQYLERENPEGTA